MIFAVLALGLLALIYGPSLWAGMVLKRHAGDRPDFPGTGGELARHLLDQAGLQEVAVEATDRGDHYDPQKKAVRLTKPHLEGRSLTAAVVAAHEVGHALQDGAGYKPLARRTELVKSTIVLQRIGSVVIFAAPVLALLTRSPGLAAMQIGAGILTMASSVVVHLATLPVEFDASFARALPLLDRGGYLPKADLPAARRILKACALTYVASSLTSLLNLWYWIRVLR